METEFLKECDNCKYEKYNKDNKPCDICAYDDEYPPIGWEPKE